MYEAGNPKLGLCDNPEGSEAGEMGAEFKRWGTYVQLMLIHVDVWQKPLQYCKAVVL